MKACGRAIAMDMALDAAVSDLLLYLDDPVVIAALDEALVYAIDRATFEAGFDMALDKAGWAENDHPRKDDGKFGKGSGGAKPKAKTPAHGGFKEGLGNIATFAKGLINDPKKRAEFLSNKDPTKKYIWKNLLADVATYAAHVPGIPGSHFGHLARMAMQYHGDPNKAWKSALFKKGEGRWGAEHLRPVPHGGALRKRVDKSGKGFIGYHGPKVVKGLKAVGRAAGGLVGKLGGSHEGAR